MQQIVGLLSENLPTMANSKPQIVLDGDLLVGRLASRMNTNLGELYAYENRGNTR